MLQYIDEILGRNTLPKWLLLPAYGRGYDSIAEARADFMDGKDFMIYQGPYCSIRDWHGEEVYVFCSGKFQKLTVGYDKYRTK
jgi:hypothetical protein